MTERDRLGAVIHNAPPAVIAQTALALEGVPDDEMLRIIVAASIGDGLVVQTEDITAGALRPLLRAELDRRIGKSMAHTGRGT